MANIKGQPVNIPVICINDKGRPNEIPLSKWIKKDAPYTIIEFVVLNAQQRQMGVRLAEVNLDGCFPYEFYRQSRFAIALEQYEKEAEEAIAKLLEPEEILAV